MGEMLKIGKRGTLVIPVEVRRRFHLEEGSFVLLELTADGIALRPAAALPVEVYSPERRAAFLLENAIDADDYAAARAAVREMGLDPDDVPHEPASQQELPSGSEPSR